MAGYEDLANKLKPFLADDKEFQEQLKHSVVLDVDTKDAQASFATIEKRIESLKKSVAEFGKGTEEALKASSALSKETGVAIAVIGEKYRQVGEQIKQTIAEITTNSEKLNFAKSGGAGKKSGLVKGLEEEQAQLKKQLESRKKIQEEYNNQLGMLGSVDNASKVNTNATSDDKTFSTVEEQIRSKLQEREKQVKALGTTIDEYAKRIQDFLPKVYMDLATGNYVKRDPNKLFDDKWLENIIAQKLHTDSVDQPYAKRTTTRDNSEIDQIINEQKTGINSLEELKGKIAETQEKLNDLRESARNGDVIDFRSTLSEIQDLGKKLKDLEKQRVSIEGKQQVPNEESMEQITSYDDLLEKIEMVKIAKERLAQLATAQGEGEEWEATVAELAEYTKALNELEKIKKTIDSANASSEENVDGTKITSYDDLVTKINMVKKARDEMSQKVADRRSDTWEEDVAQLNEYEKALKELEKLKTNIDKSKPQPVVGDQENQKVQGLFGTFSKIISLKTQLAREKNALPFSADAEASQARIKGLEKELKNFSGILASMKGGTFANAIISGFDNIGNAVKKALPQLASFTRQGMQALWNGALRLGGALRNLVSNGFSRLAKGASAVKSAFGTITKHMHSITKKATPNMLKSLTSIKSMLMRRVKRTFISAIFNQAKEGLQQLARHSQSFNAAMSSIKNSSKEAAGNLSVTLGSMVEAIAPALQTLLGWFNQLLVAINTLFALLQGKKTVAVAKQGTDDYAKSLKSASGSAKDLNHQLYGFDEITRQEDNKGSGGGKIGYEEQTVGDMYEDILALFNEGKFRELGQMLGNALNGVVKTIDDWFVSVRPKATQWARNIAELLNGIVDTNLFLTIGDAIGDGLNLAFDTAFNFLKTFDFKAFGSKISGGFNHLFDKVEWDLVGKTVSEYFNSISRTIEGFVTSANWASWGKKLGTSMNSFFSNFDWKSRKTAVTNGINGVVKLLNNFITEVQWTQIADDFGNSVKGIVDGIKWTGDDSLSSVVTNGVDSVLKAFNKLQEKDVLKDIATNFGTAVGDIFKGINWPLIGLSLRISMTHVTSAFKSFVKSCDLSGIATQMAEGINSFFNPDDFKKMGEDVSGGLNEGINAFKAFVDEINFTKIRVSLTEGIKSLLYDTDFETLITTIGTGIKTAVDEFWKLVADVFEPGVDDFGNKKKSLGEQLADGINGIFRNDSGKFDATTFADFGANISTAITNVLENIGQFIDEVKWEDIGRAIGNALGSINWVEIGKTFLDLLWKGLTGAIQLIGGIAADVIKRILGVPDKETFDVTTVKWATDFNESLVDAFNNQSEANRITLQASRIIAGFDNTGLAEEMKGRAADVLDVIYDALYDAENGSMSEELAQEYAEKLGINIVNADAFVASLQGIKEQIVEKVGTDNYDVVWNALYNSLVTASSADDVIQAFGEFGITVSEEFAQSMISMSPMIEDASTKLVETVQNPLSKSTDIEKAFEEYGISVGGSFANAIRGQAADDVSAALMLLGSGINDEFIAALDMANISENLDQFMKTNGTTLQETVASLMLMSGASLEEVSAYLGKDAGYLLAMELPKGMIQGIDEGTASVEEATEKFKEKAILGDSDQKEARESAEAVGSETTEGVSSELDNGNEEVGKSSEAITKTIDDKIKELPEKEQENAKKMMSMMVEGILEGDPLVQTAIQNSADAVVQKVTSILSGTKGREVVRNFLDGMRSEIDETFATKVQNNLVTLSGQIVSAMATRLSKSNGYTIMYNAFAGMNEAISNNGQPLVNNFAKVIQALVDTAREVLDEHSPSKVFNQIGAYVMEGMALGIESTGSDAIGAVGDVAQAIINEAENGDGIKFQIGAMADGMDVVTDKMERLAQVFSDIAATITEMGGLEIPTVASGRVLPYRTQIGGAGSAEGATFDENALESTLYSAITRALGTGSGDRDINITLSIDGRKLSDIVTKYQRQQGRAWGV